MARGHKTKIVSGKHGGHMKKGRRKKGHKKGRHKK